MEGSINTLHFKPVGLLLLHLSDLGCDLPTWTVCATDRTARSCLQVTVMQHGKHISAPVAPPFGLKITRNVLDRRCSCPERSCSISGRLRSSGNHKLHAVTGTMQVLLVRKLSWEISSSALRYKDWSPPCRIAEWFFFDSSLHQSIQPSSLISAIIYLVFSYFAPVYFHQRLFFSSFTTNKHSVSPSHSKENWTTQQSIPTSTVGHALATREMVRLR